MTDRDLIGEKVVSKHYGVGTIQKFGDGKVHIVFESTSQLRTFTLKAFDARDGEPPLKCVNSDAGQYIQGILDGPLPPPPPLPSPKKRRLFYVFQGKTYEKELSQGFIFAPYSPKERYFPFWELMSEVKVGDIILHGAGGDIIAISEATSSEYTIEMPRFAREWDKYGPNARRIDINVCWPLFPITTKDHRRKIIEECAWKSNTPFNRNGGGKQGYLFDLPEGLGAFFIHLLVSRNAKLKEVPFIRDILMQLDK